MATSCPSVTTKAEQTALPALPDLLSTKTTTTTCIKRLFSETLSLGEQVTSQEKHLKLSPTKTDVDNSPPHSDTYSEDIGSPANVPQLQLTPFLGASSSAAASSSVLSERFSLTPALLRSDSSSFTDQSYLPSRNFPFPSITAQGAAAAASTEVHIAYTTSLPKRQSPPPTPQRVSRTFSIMQASSSISPIASSLSLRRISAESKRSSLASLSSSDSPFSPSPLSLGAASATGPVRTDRVTSMQEYLSLHRGSIPPTPRAPSRKQPTPESLLFLNAAHSPSFLAFNPQLLSQIGSFKTVYSSPTNPNVVLKVFKPDHSLGGKTCKAWTQHSLEQQAWAISVGIPCARTTNNPMTDGFFVEEKIPLSLETACPALLKASWTTEEREQVAAIILQIANIFVITIQANTSPNRPESKKILDLRSSNLRIKGTTVYLIDYREEALDADELYDWSFYVRELLHEDERHDTWHGRFPQARLLLIAKIKELLGTDHVFVTSNPEIFSGSHS